MRSSVNVYNSDSAMISELLTCCSEAFVVGGSIRMESEALLKVPRIQSLVRYRVINERKGDCRRFELGTRLL